MAVSTTIFNMVCNNLHITYTLDTSTTARLTNEIETGIAYIQRYCDSAATCEPGTLSGQLLCEYVLRAESGALDSFAVDFRKDILEARNFVEVGTYAQEKGYHD